MATRTNEIDEIRIVFNAHLDMIGRGWNYKLTFSDGSIETGTVEHDGYTWEAVDKLIFQIGIDLRHEDFACEGDCAIWTNPAVIELYAVR